MKPVFVAIVTLLSCAGMAATVPRVTLIGAPDAGIQPQSVTDEHGVVHLIFLKGEPAGCDIFYVHALPGQTNFSKPLKVNRRPGSAIVWPA